jgi:hypothetical protein
VIQSFQKRREGGEKMKRVQLSLSVLVLAGMMGYIPITASAQAPGPHQPKGVKPGVLGAVALNREGSYCHLRFPAIRPSTLASDKPQLKPATTGDIIDFYGPCDYNPVGKEEVLRQKQMYEERLDNQFQ